MAKRFPKGITWTTAGWRIGLRIKGRLRQKRFKPSYTLEQVEEKLPEFRKKWKATKPDGAAANEVPESFRGDVRRYLTDHFTGHPGFAERKRQLGLWTAALQVAVSAEDPDFLRTAVTTDHIARVLNAWRAAGLAADTCNKRRTALLALYHALDGKAGSNPVRAVPKFRPPDPLPRGVSYALIEKALEQFPICKTRARLAVMAYTGVRQGQLMTLQPADWDHRRHVLTVPGTSKGRGTKPYVLPLSQAATDALKEFDGLEAWGRFTWAPMARMWKEAWIAATTGQTRIELRGKCKGLSAPVPYDLRHSFGTEVYRKTGDLKVTKELLGHSTIKMTERYMLAAVPERRQQAIRTAFQGRKLPVKVAIPRKRSTKQAV